jgi:hypothetical protein
VDSSALIVIAAAPPRAYAQELCMMPAARGAGCLDGPEEAE